jgi:LPS export ABC transporter permease LptG/LPS export ABC transporter permease LptF
MLMNQILVLSELLIARGVAFSDVSKIFVYLIPSILAFAVPMAVLMGILAGLSRLSSDFEVMAFKTLGISLRRILRPALLYGLAGWLATSFLALYLAPRSNYLWVQTITKAVMERVQFKINPREFNESISNTMIFVQGVTAKREWEKIFIYLSQPPESPRVILAKKGNLEFYPEVKRATLELFSGTAHDSPLDDPENYKITYFQHLKEDLDVESFFSSASVKKRVRERDIGELFQGIKGVKEELTRLEKEEGDGEKRNRALKEKRREHRSYQVEIHKKFALPFACFIFIFLGLPLGASTKKGGRTSGFTISIVIILIYYILITAGEKMAMDGRISPFLGMWGANILFSLMGIYLFMKAHKESPLFSWLLGAWEKKRQSEREPAQRKKRFWPKLPRLALGFPNILDRYIMRRYLFIFALIFLALLSIAVIVTFFERIDDIYEHNKSLFLLLKYIRFRIPEFIYYILPIASLTTTLLTLGILTKFNEVTAMKACGISIYRTILPVLALAAVLSGASYYVQENILPFANKRAEAVWDEIRDVPSRSHNYLNQRWILGRDKDRVFHYTYFDPRENVFSQLYIFDLDVGSWSFRRRIYAEKGSLREGKIDLSEGWVREYAEERPVKFEKIDHLSFPLEERRDYFLKEWREPDQMKFGELRHYIREVKGQGFDTVRFEVDLNHKISFPFVCLIMALLGVPFAFSMGKRGTLVGIAISIGIAMIYWGAVGASRSLGYVGFLNGPLSAWSPNLIFGLVSVYLLFKLRT